MNGEAGILLSLRPWFADAILAQNKTVELRRSRMKAQPGTVVVLYSSTPVKAVVGSATLGWVEASSPARLWSRVGGLTGVTKAEYDHYFHGASCAYGLFLVEPVALDAPIPLSQLRSEFRLEPAQSFRYLTPVQVQEMTHQDARGVAASPDAANRSVMAHRVVRAGASVLSRLVPGGRGLRQTLLAGGTSDSLKPPG